MEKETFSSAISHINADIVGAILTGECACASTLTCCICLHHPSSDCGRHVLLPVSIGATVGSNDHLRGLYGVADLKKCGGGGNWSVGKWMENSLITVLTKSFFLFFL